MASPLAETDPKSLDWGAMRALVNPEVFHLVIAWSREGPHRIGEAAPIEGPSFLGRAEEAEPDDPARPVRFYRQRPWEAREMPPLGGSGISRRQLELAPLPDGTLQVTSVGRCALLVNGEVVPPKVPRIVRPDDTVMLHNELVLLVVRRPARWQSLRNYKVATPFPFGAADPHGIVGESPAAWRLRDQLAFAAQTSHHVLVHGESGVGKELAAHAIHMLSSRCGRAFVARNASTFPAGLIDAELFGNVRGFPNATSPERWGLIGEADGGTLFLDEIAELPHDLQAHLLRVLDRGGEYQRLGEAQARRCDLRLIAATNRTLDELKHDLAARLTLRITVPGLEQRREDIALLLYHLLAEAARESSAMAERYFEPRAGGPGVPRVDPRLIEELLRFRYTHHLRDLKNLLWVALGTSQQRFVELTPEVQATLRLAALTPAWAPAPGRREAGPAPALPARAPPPQERSGRSDEPAQGGAVHPDTLTPEEIKDALAKTGGNIARTARLLRLKDRHTLYRLMKRHGIDGPDDDSEG